MPKKQTVKMLRVTLVKSAIGHPQSQKDTLRALGLRRINQTVEVPDTLPMRGMLAKVIHLIRIEE